MPAFIFLEEKNENENKENYKICENFSNNKTNYFYVNENRFELKQENIDLFLNQATKMKHFAKIELKKNENEILEKLSQRKNEESLTEYENMAFILEKIKKLKIYAKQIENELLTNHENENNSAGFFMLKKSKLERLKKMILAIKFYKMFNDEGEFLFNLRLEVK